MRLGPKTQCLFCGLVYDAVMAPLCPARYLSPHNDKDGFMTKIVNRVAKETGWDGGDGYPMDVHYKILKKELMIRQKGSDSFLS